jgi:hypothetical protein
MGDSFAADLAELAKRLSSAQIDAWTEVLNAAPAPTESTASALVDTQVGYGATGAAHQLVTSWRAHAPRLPGPAVALALGAAAVACEEAERRRPKLVVSGPMTSAVAVRLTSAAVIEVIRAAADRVLLVSFAAHGSTARRSAIGGQPATSTGCHPRVGADATFAARETPIPSPNASQLATRTRRLP